MKNDLIVIRVDGGICSQLGFVALGLKIQARGFRVKYDLSWFRDFGKDKNGRLARNWDMPKAFPQLKLEEASVEEIEILRTRRRRRSENVDSYEPPLYIDGYPERDHAFIDLLPTFRRCFSPKLDSRMENLVRELREKRSCAVHVRRGDLAMGDVYYGGATSIDYFARAISIVRSLFPDMRFYFFSDEPDWVRDVLLPGIGGTDEFQVVADNGSDRGFLDLYAMSVCDCVISSIGSLGVFGALLSSCNRLLVMSHKRDWVSMGVPNVCYLNDDFGRSAIPSVDSALGMIPERKTRGIWRIPLCLWTSLGRLLSRN